MSIVNVQQDIQADLWRVVEKEALQRTQRMLNELMERERMLFLGCARYERAIERRGRRNGFDSRSLDTRFGLVRLRIPKVRGSASPFRSRIIKAYQRRQDHLERCALEWVACGMSTRAVSCEMRRAFGAVLSAATVSNLLASLDAEIAAFRSRPLAHSYRYVYLDGKYGKISRPRGRGRGRGRSREGVLLLAWGIRHDGHEELIDFAVAPDESESSWDGFLRRLRERGLVEENRWAQRLERFITDGHSGIAAALALNYPHTPQQVCLFHKVKNILGDLNDKSRKGQIQGQAGAVFEAPTRAEANARLEEWKRRWRVSESRAVSNFVRDIDRMMLFYESPLSLRTRVKTSNPVERFIRELDRKFARVGVFPSIRSWERITYLVYRQLLQRGYAPISPRSTFTRTS